MTSNKVFFIFIFILILAPMLITTNAANAATVYKWVDEDGQVHYGSRPENKDAQKIEIKNRYIDSGQSSTSLNAEERFNKLKRFNDAADAEKESIADYKRKKEAAAELKIRRCNASRDQLRRAENSGALYDLDEKGDRILLNKKQYEQAMKQARARVQKWCN